MKIPVWLVLSALPVLHAEEVKEASPAAEAPVAEAAAPEVKPSAEELLKQLVTTAKVEMEAYQKATNNRNWNLDPFLKSLEEQQSKGGFHTVSEATMLLSGAFPYANHFAKTQALTTAYIDQLGIEIEERRKQFDDACVRYLSALMKRATETQEVEKLEQVGRDLNDFFREAIQEAAQLDARGEIRYPNLSSEQSSIQSFLYYLSKFQSHRVKEQWSSAVSSLEMLGKLAPGLKRYLPEEEAKALITNCQKSIGLLPSEEAQRLFDAKVTELLDDKNQDRLDAIQETVRKQAELSRKIAKSSLSQKWQVLSELATGFSQNVTGMKRGGPPQFSPEQWYRANPDTAEIIGRDEFVELMKRYRVRLMDDSGKVREEPIYFDMNEVIARIQTPADIARELPVFLKAAKQAANSSESSVNWQNLGQRLQQYADLFAKLESGVSFSLGGYSQGDYNYERSNTPVVEDAATKKSADLNQQLQWMIVQRFLPEAAADPNSTPAKVVADRFAQAKTGNDYQVMLTLGRLSAYLTPGQGLLTPQDGLAIQCYLDGVKQQEELDQPRLATFYFQRAAAVPNSPIPPSAFKARLKALKREAPKDYEKGTDDALGRSFDTSGMGVHGPVMVPEKRTAEKAPGGK